MLSAVTSRITPATAVCVFRRSAACSEDKMRCFHNALQRRYIEERALLRAGHHVEVLRINFWFVLLQLRSIGMLHVHGRRRLARKIYRYHLLWLGRSVLASPKICVHVFHNRSYVRFSCSFPFCPCISLSLVPHLLARHTPATCNMQFDVCNFIDGEMRESAATDWIDVNSPATQALVCRVPRSTEGEVCRCMEMHRSARQSGINHGGDRACRLELPHESFVLHAYFERISMASKPSHSSSLLPGRKKEIRLYDGEPPFLCGND